MKRVIIARRGGADEPDALGNGCKGRENDQRIHGVRPVPVGTLLNGQHIAQEKGIEAAILGATRNIDPVVEIGRGKALLSGMRQAASWLPKPKMTALSPMRRLFVMAWCRGKRWNSSW